MKIDINKLSNNAADNSFISLMGGNSVTEIPLSQLIETENQPFKVLDDERMETLIQDIKINGVLEPVIVTEENGKYRILAGHRRTHASRLANKKTIPCIIKQVKPATEKLIITNTNLTQRKEFSPSELAKAYQMQLEGYQELDAHPVRTTAQIAEDNNVSKRTIQYYLKLNNLNSNILDLVDEEIITVKAGAALSILSFEQQGFLSNYIISNKIKKVDENTAKEITSETEITDAFLNHLFFPNKKADELKYDTYIVNRSTLENIISGIKDIEYSNAMIKGKVLKKTDYAKLQNAQCKIYKQLKAIQKILDKN